MFEQIIGNIALILDAVGMLIVIAGAAIAIFMILKIEYRRVKKKFLQYEHMKREFIQKLVFGLDFFIAGDILRIVIMPGWEELSRLGLIVAIRTVLSYFLGREIHLHKAD